MKVILIIISLLFFQKILAQKNDCTCNYITDYYQFVYKGQLHFLKENYDLAYHYLKLAEKGCPLKNHQGINEILLLAESSVKLNKPDEALKYLEMQLRNGYKFEYFETDSIYQSLRDTKGWNELELKSDGIYEEWYSSLNLDLRNELIRMNKEDQRVRTTKPIDFDEMKRVDSINIKRLKEILRDYGYPSQHLIGKGFLDQQHADIHTMIMHIQGEEDMNYFKPVFLEWVKCGKSDYPSIYADLIDSNDRSRGIFTYGIYFRTSPEFIDDFENLDRKRISVGLAPFEIQNEINEILIKRYEEATDDAY